MSNVAAGSFQLFVCFIQVLTGRVYKQIRFDRHPDPDSTYMLTNPGNRANRCSWGYLWMTKQCVGFFVNFYSVCECSTIRFRFFKPFTFCEDFFSFNHEKNYRERTKILGHSCPISCLYMQTLNLFETHSENRTLQL